jgi:hypothetical protein
MRPVGFADQVEVDAVIALDDRVNNNVIASEPSDERGNPE